MTELNIIMENGENFPMIIPYPSHLVTKKELLRRLNLKNEWSYNILCRYKHDIFYIDTNPNPNDPDYDYDNQKSIPNFSTIVMFKKSTEPILKYHKNSKIIEQIKKNEEKTPNIPHILVWLDYNMFYKPNEPVCLFFIYKENGIWIDQKKTSSLDELKNIIENNLNQNIFCVTKVAYQRFNELIKLYSF